jgi:hypothetical protein
MGPEEETAAVIKGVKLLAEPAILEHEIRQGQRELAGC